MSPSLTAVSWNVVEITLLGLEKKKNYHEHLNYLANYSLSEGNKAPAFVNNARRVLRSFEKSLKRVKCSNKCHLVGSLFVWCASPFLDLSLRLLRSDTCHCGMMIKYVLRKIGTWKVVTTWLTHLSKSLLLQRMEAHTIFATHILLPRDLSRHFDCLFRSENCSNFSLLQRCSRNIVLFE